MREGGAGSVARGLGAGARGLGPGGRGSGPGGWGLGPDARVRATAWVTLTVLALTIAACAPKLAPPVTVTPRHPDFVFPGVPRAMAGGAVTERHERAWRFLQADDLRNAEREFQAVVKRAPAFYPSEAGLAYVALARRDHKGALERFDRVLQKSGPYAPALVGKGQVLLALKREGEALASFEAAVAADPSLTEVKQRIEVLAFRRVQDDLTRARRAAEAGRLEEARDGYQRAIAGSPESAFLHRDLGGVERRLGDTDSALARFRRAVELDPTDGRSLVQIGEILEERADFEGAIAAYSRALAIDPSEGLEDKIERARAAAELARLPAEYRAIPESSPITRGELAAVIGVRLDDLLAAARRRPAAVITDTRGHWAAGWVATVVRAGVMEIYPNHTFQPRGVIGRGELALAVSRLLNLVAAKRPTLAKNWQGVRVKVSDVGAGHLSYPAVSLAVASGVMPLLDGDTFQLSRPVSGADAIDAIERIERLAAAPRSRKSPWPR